jgi:DNA-binding transcriptional MocR family regulator
MITPAGSTYPHFHDPANSNIRLAPTFLGLEDLKEAMEVFTTSLQLAFEE